MKYPTKLLFIILFLISAALFGAITRQNTPITISQVTPTPAFTLQFTCAEAIQGKTSKVCVHTQPFSQVSLTITYCSQYEAASQSLRGMYQADVQGNYTWYWIPQSVCTGQATADVTARWKGYVVEKSVSFAVE